MHSLFVILGQTPRRSAAGLTRDSILGARRISGLKPCTSFVETPKPRLLCSPSRTVACSAPQLAVAPQQPGTETCPSAAFTAFNPRPIQVPPLERKQQCRRCKGSSLVACTDCSGAGILQRGGYHRNNPVNLSKIVGTKWTARNPTLGRTHFHAAEKKKSGKETFILMTGSCDDSVKLWINAANLKDRQRWSAGWLERAERAVIDSNGIACKACKGSGRMQCPLCANAGHVVEM